ncbi:MAG TPA: hypothetical protein VGK32_17025 [Vicinamibacterales bacterium]|jgi:hypothetical protein
MDQTTSILSLTVALLAVIAGPFVSWVITRRTLASSERVAVRQVIAPMRQAWINDLRARLAELSATTQHYFVAGYEDRTDKEYRRVAQLEQEIVLMLNPLEAEHQALQQTIRELVSSLERGKGADDSFIAAHGRTTELGRTILKTEWNRVKTGT